MRETRWGRATLIDTNEYDVISVINEKFDKLNADLLLEIKELIHLEVEKAIKKQKELEHAHDDLEWYGHRSCVCVEDIPVANDETADKALKKVNNILTEACQAYLIMLLTKPLYCEQLQIF